MKPFMLFLLLAAMGNCAYHLGQKSLNQTINPMLMLNLIYASAWLLTGLLMPFFGKMQWSDVPVLWTDWRLWLVAAGTLCIELGFLLAYHAGGSVQWSGVAVNGMAALLLMPMSIVLFHETLSWTKLLGMVLTLLGLYFLVKT